MNADSKALESERTLRITHHRIFNQRILIAWVEQEGKERMIKKNITAETREHRHTFS